MHLRIVKKVPPAAEKKRRTISPLCLSVFKKIEFILLRSFSMSNFVKKHIPQQKPNQL